MKDLDRLITRFRQFGGMRLVWQYAKMRVLWIGIKEIVKCALKGKSFKTVYPIITERIDRILVERYGNIKAETNNCNLPFDSGEEKNTKIWFCWLQGIENASEMVKVCLESQKRIFGDRVVVLDDKNYRKWIELPDYIEEKYRKGYIPGALFSDILRLELLIKYGGMWVDSTVLVTQIVTDKDCGLQAYKGLTIDEIEKSDLFIFRYYRSGKVLGISNWLIHAKAGNSFLMNLRDMLLAYWKDFDCTVEYYIFHIFFGVVAKRYPEMIMRMPKGNSFHAIMLRDRLAMDYNESWWKELTQHVCFHKLNYRQEGKAIANPMSFWNHINDEYQIR